MSMNNRQEGLSLHIHRVGFCVARIDNDGQCETPEAWDEQLVQQPTLFCIMYQTI